MISHQALPQQSAALSTLDWLGLHSQKFKGGRFHLNHPTDELDSLLISSKSSELQPQGKRQFKQPINYKGSKQFKPSVRTFEIKYKRSTVFDEQNIPKLIKVPFVTDDHSNRLDTTGKYDYSTLGRSKIKALQSGLKQTGIYRQFYHSQTKSSNVILSHH